MKVTGHRQGRSATVEKNAKFRVGILGNYAADRQQSMERFAVLLSEGLRAAGHEVDILRPLLLFGKHVKKPFRAPGKWFAYIDKYLITPIWLRKRIRKSDKNTIFHICDHANAVYRKAFKGRCLVATCHDLLAVRGAFGDASVHCPARPSGLILQKWILGELSKISALGCDSCATLEDVRRLALFSSHRIARVIYPPVNPAFRKIERDVAMNKVGKYVPKTQFLLHVGSNLPRKNRQGVLRVVKALVAKGWDGQVIFVGERLSVELEKVAKDLSIKNRVTDIGAVDHEMLNAFYSGAVALLFPSYSEGFGWPVLEAQASGCPVVCTNRTSVPEIAGAAAFQFCPDDVDGMANAILKLQHKTLREKCVEEGLVNVRSFTMEKFVEGYLDLYGEIQEKHFKED